MTPEWVVIAEQVVNVLEKLDVPYAICGSTTSIIHGVVRATIDCDLVADFQTQHVEAFTTALSQDFYVDADQIREALFRRSSFNVIHYQTHFKIDIFLPKDRFFERGQLEHRRQETIADRTFWVTSPEDIVLAKLEWFRIGNEVSERQWRDVLGVLKNHSAKFDLGYMRKAAAALGVADLLEQALLAAAETDEPQLQ